MSLSAGTKTSFAKQILLLVIFQALLCLLASYLISKISLIGKIGIAIFYKEYGLLRSMPKTFALFFLLQLLIIFLIGFIHKKYSAKRTIFSAAVIFIIALIGLISTYNNFLHTYSHRLLKERFHLGFYLFWIGMMISCVFFIIISRYKVPAGLPGPGTEDINEIRSSQFNDAGPGNNGP